METYYEDSVSLYFGLHEGKKADLEVVSRAAIEWVRSVRLATQMVAPGVDVRLEFVNAHESSLSINSALKFLEGQLEKSESLIQYPKLTRLAVALALLLAIDAGPATDYWFGGPDTLELSDEDRRKFDELLAAISQSNELKAANRKFFSIVEKDPSVSAVSICEAPGGFC